ncbi:MAG: hypothetical protein ACRYGR_00765 [Janthinobacterium lividum]
MKNMTYFRKTQILTLAFGLMITSGYTSDRQDEIIKQAMHTLLNETENDLEIATTLADILIEYKEVKKQQRKIIKSFDLFQNKFQSNLSNLSEKVYPHDKAIADEFIKLHPLN